MSAQKDISIHALREEGDDAGIDTERLGWIFLSTPSARRATASIAAARSRHCYFYPRPPRGGRPGFGVSVSGVHLHFYPRPPRGGRLPFRVPVFRYL